ncbi:hypothetical protein DENSPDRAFT_886398 [Dentipellis sp. KUC8613]|nr:hypothetical protein DENSPDRAFT_886398 [Dentipellis sp. KUC8613]
MPIPRPPCAPPSCVLVLTPSHSRAATAHSGAYAALSRHVAPRCARSCCVAPVRAVYGPCVPSPTRSCSFPPPRVISRLCTFFRAHTCPCRARTSGIPPVPPGSRLCTSRCRHVRPHVVSRTGPPLAVSPPPSAIAVRAHTGPRRPPLMCLCRCLVGLRRPLAPHRHHLAPLRRQQRNGQLLAPRSRPSRTALPLGRTPATPFAAPSYDTSPSRAAGKPIHVLTTP